MSDEQTNIEQQAKDMGWSPKEEFRGSPDNWIDAETYVKRGTELMPILKANNRKLSEELSGMRVELASTKEVLKSSTEAIEALKAFNSEMTREKAKERQGELLTAIKEAKTAGDVETEVALTDQLTDHKAALKAAEAAPKPRPAVEPPKDFTQEPGWRAWTAENPWFGQDKRRTSIAVAIASELRGDPANASLLGRSFLDKVAEEVDRTLGGDSRRNGADKVEGSRGSGSSASRGKSYADLPADAREACEKYGKRLVGPGRAYKTADEWRKKYVSDYYAGEE